MWASGRCNLRCKRRRFLSALQNSDYPTESHCRSYLTWRSAIGFQGVLNCNWHWERDSGYNQSWPRYDHLWFHDFMISKNFITWDFICSKFFKLLLTCLLCSSIVYIEQCTFVNSNFQFACKLDSYLISKSICVSAFKFLVRLNVVRKE